MAPKKSLSHRSRRPRVGPGGSRWQAARDRTGAPHGAWQAGPAIAWLPTLCRKGPQPLEPHHLRQPTPPGRAPRLHLVVLDTSGSMRRHGRLALAKGHAAWLLEHAARAGDDAALLGFGGQGVQLLLPPGPARLSRAAQVRPLGGGGGTPLVDALAQAEQVLRRVERRRGPTDSWLWLLTDGRTLEQPAAPRSARHIVIVDFEDLGSRWGRCASWAARWGAEHRLAT